MDNQTEELFGQTPWQTVGPFFHPAMAWHGGADLSGQTSAGSRPELIPEGHDHLPAHAPGAPLLGERIEIFGQVRDGAGDPVPDALLEIWHADATGHYGSGFAAFGRCATDDQGGYRFATVRPGAVTDAAGLTHAPQISVGLYARGLIKRLLTRIYFDGAPENTADPALVLVPAERQPTLLAVQRNSGWQFDIVLQGPFETVFFRC